MKASAVSLLAALTLASATSAQQKKDPFDSTYGALTDRNPFVRERHAPRPPKPRPTRTTDDPGNRSRTYVLRGVAIEDEQLHAYLENTRGGEIIRVAPGDALGDGRIVDIAIDAIAYEGNGRVQWVEVGQDLTGTRGTSSSAAPPTTSEAGTQPAGTPPPPLPPGGGTLAERMRLRAQQLRAKK